MRLAQHLLYAVAALIGVLIALKDPAMSVAMASVDNTAAAVCRDDHLERPCNPGIQVAGYIQDGHVVAR